MNMESQDNSIQYGEWDSRGAFDDLIRTFDKQFDPSRSQKDRQKLVDAIHDEKYSALQSVGIDADMNGVVSHEGGVPHFTDETRLQEARDTLVSQTLNAVQDFKDKPSRKTFITAYGRLEAFGQLILFDASTIARSQDFKTKGNTNTVGVQDAQTDAVMAMFSLHSVEVESGQGKSTPDMPLAVVARALLAGDQIHHMVRDPQARMRDSAVVKKLAEPLGLTVQILESTADIKSDISELQKLLMVHDAYIGMEAVGENKMKLKRVDKRIHELQSKISFSRAKRHLMPQGAPVIPDIVVGDDSDFVFSKLHGNSPEIWARSPVLMGDEGDLPFRKGSPYIVEKPGIHVIETYLPDWIGMAVSDTICNEMFKNGEIALNKGQLDFLESEDAAAERHFEEQFSAQMQKVRDTGDLPKELIDSLRSQLKQKISQLPIGIRPERTLLDTDIKKLIQSYTPNGPENMSSFFAQAWMRAKALQEGVHFRAQDNETILIHSETGHQLRNHQFTDLIDVAVDVSAGVCGLKARSADTEQSTGFYHFLTHAYGEKRAIIVTATASDIAGDIRHILGKPLVNAERWIGEPLEIPNARIIGDRDVAVNTLREICQNHQGPILVVSTNETEGELLTGESKKWSLPGRSVQSTHTVSSGTTLQHETEIFKHAGERNAITFANPRAGRMIDIQTTPEADAAGGLLVVIWGALGSYSVLKQVLARTKRAGHPGDVAWITYAHGGVEALENLQIVKQIPALQKQLSTLSSDQTVPYEGSVLEAIHVEEQEKQSAQRLRTLLEDTIRSTLKERIYASLWEFFSVQSSYPTHVQRGSLIQNILESHELDGHILSIDGNLWKIQAKNGKFITTVESDDVLKPTPSLTERYLTNEILPRGLKLISATYATRAFDERFGSEITGLSKASTNSILVNHGVSNYAQFLSAYREYHTSLMNTENDATAIVDSSISNLFLWQLELKKSIEAWQKISKERSASASRSPLFLKTIDPNRKNLTRFDISFHEMKNEMITFETIEHITKGKRKAAPRKETEVRMRITKLTDDHVIDDQYEISVLRPTADFQSIEEFKTRNMELSKLRELFESYMIKRGVPQFKINRIVKELQKHQVFASQPIMQKKQQNKTTSLQKK